MTARLVQIRSRRSFIKGSALALASIPLISRLSPETAMAQTPPTKALDENNDAMAKGLGYVHDASKADASKRTNAQSVCKNCILFTKGGLKAEGKEGEWGQCSLFPQGLVNANGWCISWAQKPGA